MSEHAKDEVGIVKVLQYEDDNGKTYAPIKAWTDGVEMEHEAVNQLYNVSQMPFVYKHIAVMPDVHYGIGATVGSVIPTKGAIIPAAVGVDIGCGMMAVATSVRAADLPDSLSEVRVAIEAAVPVGMNSHGDDLPRFIENAWYKQLKTRYEFVESRCKKIAPKKSAAFQLGTLGGGNHFIEVCLDETDRVWLMLHSGSRGIGNKIGTYYIAEAKKEMEKHFIHLPDVNLAYVVEGSTLFNDYVGAVSWAQDYAALNRDCMMQLVITAFFDALGIGHTLEQGPLAVGTSVAVSCHHNYISKENHFGENVYVTRKGAVRARAGDLGIIPGSMGVRSYIVRGKGNKDSFESCSHGAGRRMSRGEAKRRFNLGDHAAATAGVECRKDEGVIDETPQAYKDIGAVMAAQQDLVEIVHTLKQVVCVKG